MSSKIKPYKYPFLFAMYVWLRLDPILWITFRSNWTARFEFMASIFGEKDAEQFLKHRVKLVKARNVATAPLITPQLVQEEVKKFLSITPDSKTRKEKRKNIIHRLIHWALDEEINRQNVDSYKTRSAIVSALLGEIFQNSLCSNTSYILGGLKKIVFSRVTNLSSTGEPSPVVHDVILSGVARILTAHLYEVERLKDIQVDKLTKMKLIKEINKAKDKTGSLAFSAEAIENPDFKQKYPLSPKHLNLLIEILAHYKYSAWPESREKAISIYENIEAQLGYDLNQSFIE